MTTRSTDRPSRLKAAWQALWGTPPPEPGDPRARIAALELDLRERDAEISRLREAHRQLAEQAQAEEPQANTGPDPRARIAALELDLRERDAELARVREEYRRLGGEATRDRAGAVAEGFGQLAKRLAPLFSQLATMQSLAEAGRELRCADVLKLFGKVEAVLGEAGLVRIGTVGEQAPFDTRLHQRMSGADVQDDATVTIRFVGYRLGEIILLKAMVSRAGGAPEPADDL